MTTARRDAKKKGLKRVDATSDLVVEVLPSDVRKSLPKDPEHCAFASACKRGIPGVKEAYFYRSTAWLSYADKQVRYSLPPSVQKEIVVFDRGGKTEPGVFKLNKPKGVKKLKAIHGYNKTQNARRKAAKGRKVQKRPIRHRTTSVRTMAYERANA